MIWLWVAGWYVFAMLLLAWLFGRAPLEPDDEDWG